MLCQLCGSDDHQSTTLPQAEVCPMYKTENYSLKYICPMLKEVKKQDRNTRNYRDGNHTEQVIQVNDGAAIIQNDLIVKLPTPMVRQRQQLDRQNVHSDNESP